MKKTCLYILSFFILFPLSTNAKTIKYFGVGTTSAALRSEGGKSEWGKFIGFGLEYSKPSSLLLGIEAAYTTKKVILENKTWTSSWDPYNSGMSIGDIPIDGSFYELTAKIGYHIPIADIKAAIKLFTGSALSLQSRYLSFFRASTALDYDPEHGQYEFDYLRCESDGTVPSMSIDGIMGLIISYKMVGVEVRYAKSYTERTCTRGLTINGKLDTFYISLRYGF